MNTYRCRGAFCNLMRGDCLLAKGLGIRRWVLPPSLVPLKLGTRTDSDVCRCVENGGEMYLVDWHSRRGSRFRADDLSLQTLPPIDSRTILAWAHTPPNFRLVICGWTVKPCILCGRLPSQYLKHHQKKSIKEGAVLELKHFRC